MASRSISLWVATALAVAGLNLAGCARRGSAVESGNQTQTIHIGNLSEPTDLDPHLTTSQQNFNIVMAFFEGLAQYDAKTSQPVPAVAERWEVSADNLTWTFHLRSTARWSNGEPVTANDFVYAFRRILMPGLAAEYANMLYVLKNATAFNKGQTRDPAEVGVRAVDAHTLVLTLDHPVPYLPTMVCHSAWYPIPAATIEKFGKVDQRGSPWTRPGNLVGNGYFTLTEWKPNQYIRGTKSTTYWDRDNVKLNEVNFYPIESADAEERSFRSGQLHVTASIPTSKISVYEKQKSPSFHPTVLLATYVFRFNVNVPPLNDARVRRALAMAIDRESIVRDVVRGGQVPAGNFCPPNVAGFTAQAKLETDIPGAKKLLAEAGFPDGRGFPKLDLLFNTNEGHRQIAEALQQMWRNNLGIDIGLYNQEAKVWTDSMRTLNYQIARFAWVGDYLDPSTFLDIMTSDNGNNQTGWKSAEYDRLIGAARTSGDSAKRYEYYQQCEKILVEECPIAPVYFYSRNNLRRPEVKGWYGNLLDLHPLKGVYLDASGK
jgi:oligopeptide transport system substrate-binding protein